MPELQTCPDAARLREPLAGSLSAAEQDALSRHVEGCDACQKALDELARNSWDDKARRLEPDTPPDPALCNVMRQALGHETQAEAKPRAVEPELGFLGKSDNPKHLGRLGHYEIIEVVGRGGMGIVLKAFDERLHRVVAIKVLLPELAASAAARQRFTREARAAAAIAHDHLVTIHAVEDDHRPPYFVMQYVEGISLQQ